MVVNFRARGISRDARKLVRTPTLKKKKKKHCIRPALFTSREKNKLMIDDPFKATFFVFSAFQQGLRIQRSRSFDC
jgi:hypothetical protein